MKYIFILTALSMLLSGCDSREISGSQQDEEAKALALKLAVSSHEGSASSEAALYFASLINERSKGQLTVSASFKPNNVSERELIASVQKGEVDFAVVTSSKMSYLYPSLELFDLPFFFTDHEQVTQVYESPAGKLLLNSLRKKELVGLAFWDGGFKHLVTTFPMETISQLDQRRFRVTESAIIKQQFSAWKSLAIPVSDEVVTQAFSNGDLDGEEITLSRLSARRIAGQKLYLTRHGHQTQILIMSEKANAKLSEAQKTLINSASNIATSFQNEISHRKDHVALANLREEGITRQPSDSLLADLKASSSNIMEHNRMRIGTAIIEQVLQGKENWNHPHPDKLIVALDADMIGGSAISGLSIRRGIELALEEINQGGGVLGKEVKLVVRNNSMVPSRGLDNIAIFSELPNLIAVFGGISSPVVLAELDLLHQHKILMLAPWAAATPIVSNGQNPNFVFRVSVRDEYAAQFMLDGALSVSKKVGFLLVNNGWGRSNFEGLTKEMKRRTLAPVHVEWFDWGEKNMGNKVKNLVQKGVESIIFVGNAVEGEKFVYQLAKYPNPPVVFSHWGITGSEFARRSESALRAVDLRVLQTFTFVENNTPEAKTLVQRYHRRYGTKKESDIYAPSGTAHAYDLMHMLAIAAEKAGSADMSAIQKELTKLDRYNGLLKQYRSPFDRGKQDALTSEDYLFAHYKDGSLYPLESDR
ncbi:TRAP transporter substrate-binding protein DctP [Grimontia marina]|uniref:C4-dicarboxylate-binding periplasmic protein n=1 Tax=Grimontia marina TaxID=646534 RepID=A0A128ETM0_9GAMM|nr:TRAP transporter substrate-binding protein DctP [Grimontia marina]CZF77929.1 C4-dicarboxylate-binding periplasmic protein precursor [Grimontia marina]